ncbi:DNA primase [Paraburkholderia sp. UCT70]
MSVPIAWDELADVQSGDQWHLQSTVARMQSSVDPWGTTGTVTQSITAAMARQLHLATQK